MFMNRSWMVCELFVWTTLDPESSWKLVRAVCVTFMPISNWADIQEMQDLLWLHWNRACCVDSSEVDIEIDKYALTQLDYLLEWMDSMVKSSENVSPWLHVLYWCFHSGPDPHVFLCQLEIHEQHPDDCRTMSGTAVGRIFVWYPARLAGQVLAPKTW